MALELSPLWSPLWSNFHFYWTVCPLNTSMTCFLMLSETGLPSPETCQHDLLQQLQVNVNEEDLVKIHLYTRMQLPADSALWTPMLPLCPRLRSVDLLTSANLIKSCARQEDLSHHPPSPKHTHKCVQSCTNQTSILAACLLLLLLVPCGKQITISAHSESGQLLSHLDPKMWVSFHYASGITGTLWMSNISVLK